MTDSLTSNSITLEGNLFPNLIIIIEFLAKYI